MENLGTAPTVMLMFGEYTGAILFAFFGFIAVATILLLPVYLFLKREERDSEYWTHENLARELHERPPTNGAPTHDASTHESG